VSRLAAEGISVTPDEILDGLALFELPVAPPPSFPVAKDSTGAPLSGLGCSACHLGAEMTGASMRHLAGPGLAPGHLVFKNAGFDFRMERMFTRLDWAPPGPLSPVPAGTDAISYDTATYATYVTGISGGTVTPPIQLPVVVYDSGWYNIGVRPTSDDLGLGGRDPFGRPLSWTQYFQETLAKPGIIKIPGGGLASGCVPPAAPPTSVFAGEVINPLTGLPLLSGPLLKTEPTGVAGSFKTLSLRNVELTAPYFHNGGKSTLAQVVEFYDDGGDFDNPTKSPLIVPLGMSDSDVKSLVAFMTALTDERVRYEKAPFDHPELPLPNGAKDGAATSDEMAAPLPATGASGRAQPIGRFLNLDPFK
jgi:hypothetical protein